MFNLTHFAGYPFANTTKRLQVFIFGYLSDLFLINYIGEVSLSASYGSF